MHRFILGLPVWNPPVDHKNGDGLDNRRSNLRVCSWAQNSGNRVLDSRNTTGFKGVSFCVANKKFHAALRAKGEAYHLGYFEDAISAAKAYDAGAIQHFGEFAKTNASLGLL